jgi:hypothetical protein
MNLARTNVRRSSDKGLPKHEQTPKPTLEKKHIKASHIKASRITTEVLEINSPTTTNNLLQTYKSKLLEAEAHVAKLDLELQEATINDLGKFAKPPLYNNEKPKRKYKREAKKDELASQDAELDAAIRRENPNYVNNEAQLVSKLISEFKTQMQEQQNVLLSDIKNMIQDAYQNQKTRHARVKSDNHLELLEKNIEMQQAELVNKLQRKMKGDKTWYEDSEECSDAEEPRPPLKTRLSNSVSSTSLEKIDLGPARKSSRSAESTIRSSIPTLPSIYARPVEAMEVSTEWIPV